MTIGRFSVYVSRDWGVSYIEGACLCKILYMGPLEITWHGRDCKCQACGGYVCRCQKE
jgi:hypothetical protein